MLSMPGTDIIRSKYSVVSISIIQIKILCARMKTRLLELKPSIVEHGVEWYLRCEENSFYSTEGFRVKNGSKSVSFGRFRT
jgi:hypothetical protein